MAVGLSLECYNHFCRWLRNVGSTRPLTELDIAIMAREKWSVGPVWITASRGGAACVVFLCVFNSQDVGSHVIGM